MSPESERMTPERRPDPARFVSPASVPEQGRLLRIRLHLADRPLVMPGQRVDLGQPIVEHFREQEAVEIPTTAAVVGLRPGEVLDGVAVQQTGRLGRRSTQGTYRTRVCEHGRDGITRLAAGSSALVVTAPAAGYVEAVLPGRIDLRSEGLPPTAWWAGAAPHRAGSSSPSIGRTRRCRPPGST